jgi:hypothetical protein
MRKPKPQKLQRVKARTPSKSPVPALRNARLGAQTRSILAQHYRAKHGVK